jgi:hypothetical protein
MAARGQTSPGSPASASQQKLSPLRRPESQPSGTSFRAGQLRISPRPGSRPQTVGTRATVGSQGQVPFPVLTAGMLQISQSDPGRTGRFGMDVQGQQLEPLPGRTLSPLSKPGLVGTRFV